MASISCGPSFAIRGGLSTSAKCRSPNRQAPRMSVFEHRFEKARNLLLKKVPKAHFNPSSNSQLCEDFATENARLRRENERLRMLREILKNAAHLLGTAEMKFRLIEDQRGTFPVRVFCGVPGRLCGRVLCLAPPP
jgi:transposase-like protein